MASSTRPAREFSRMTASQIARLVSGGEASAVEIVEAHIARIEEVNPKLNAVVVMLYEQARREAKGRDAARARGESLGPLAGVPITIKESFDVSGAPSTYGLAQRARQRALGDSPNVARLRRAGAIVLGKTNVPQLLMANETDNPLYGRTNNPWKLDRSPGGSSGGEAAIVAACGSALGLGSDSGGSLRLPANACGICAFKPTSHRLTLRGQLTAPGSSFSQGGPLARTASDLALALRLLVVAPGEQNADPKVPPVLLGDPARVELGRLRVAFYTDNGIFRPSPAVRRAVEEGARALAARGVAVEEWTPLDAGEGWEIYQRMLVADGLRGARRLLRSEKLGSPIRRLIRVARAPAPARALLAKWLEWKGEARLAEGVRRIRELSAGDYGQLLRLRDEYRMRFANELDLHGYDAILAPAHALAALPPGASFELTDAISYTALYNLLGMPAGVVAATRVRPGEESDRRHERGRAVKAALRAEAGSAGLPVGVQVAARHWREDVALALMSAVEQHFRSEHDFPAEPPI
ncbi:MAG TPA: amidase family protein [Candidatus Acidoferrales bacterium]|nr:amidase family protein [Candidatus Acidoferrales bacterium]